MKTKALISLLLFSFLLIVGLYLSPQYLNWNGAEHSQRPEENPVFTYATDYENPRILLGYAQEVFVAKIIQETGSSLQSLPGGSTLAHFQYKAEVFYNIKGVASGEIMIDLEAFEGARFMPGSTYVLAARHWNETGDWYYVGSPAAFHVLVTDNSQLTKDELDELVRKHPRTYELLNAYPNEILRSIDIQKNRAINSFQSLSEIEKQTVYDKFLELIPPRPIPETLPPPPEIDPRENFGSACRDGIDNDGDGLTDRSDSECTGFFREDLPGRCRDNDDNDLDGLKDSADPDCAQFYPQQSPPPPPPLPSGPPTSTPPVSTSTQS